MHVRRRPDLLNNGTCTKMEPETQDAGSTAVIMAAAGHRKCEIRPVPCSSTALPVSPASQPASFCLHSRFPYLYVR